MMQESDLTKQDIQITVLKHRTTDLFMAVSRDLPGLMVPGRSENELVDKLPAAIRELLEAEGHTVHDDVLIREDPAYPPDFLPPSYIAHAVLQSA